jgi:hypothetical protein
MPATITKCGTQTCAANGRDGSLADICIAKCHVRFAPQSGHVRCNWGCPLWANSGHRRGQVRSSHYPANKKS